MRMRKQTERITDPISVERHQSTRRNPNTSPKGTITVAMSVSVGRRSARTDLGRQAPKDRTARVRGYERGGWKMGSEQARSDSLGPSITWLRFGRSSASGSASIASGACTIGAVGGSD